MKRVLIVLAVFLVLFTACGCGSGEPEQSSKPAEETTVSAEEKKAEEEKKAAQEKKAAEEKAAAEKAAKEAEPPTDEELVNQVNESIRYRPSGEWVEGVANVSSSIKTDEEGKRVMYVYVYDKELSSKYDMDDYARTIIGIAGKYVDMIDLLVTTDMVKMDGTVVPEVDVMMCQIPKAVINAKLNNDIVQVLPHLPEDYVGIRPEFQ